MKKQLRKTEFWGSETPSKVGPGSYEVSPSRKYRNNSAPFSKAEIKSNNLKIFPNELPGPGSYTPSLEWKKDVSPSSIFISNLPRTGPIPTGQFGLASNSSIETPGPGAYYTETSKPLKKYQKVRQISMIVEASVASIPYKPGYDQILGPTSYEVNDSLVKKKITSPNFSMNSSKRDIFDMKTNVNVGPGKYSIDKNTEKKKASWIFTSKVSKNVDQRLEQVPGPGTYNPKYYTKQPRVLVEGFGSTTERDISLTNDPHRPYANSNNLLPGLSNEAVLQAEKFEFFRQKYLNPKIPIPKPAFGTSEKRESKWVNTSTIAGPGDYYDKPLSSHSPKLSTKSPRFKEPKLSPLPGPGSYNVFEPLKNPIYLSQSKRFKEEKNLAPESYISHQPWKIKQNRASDIKDLDNNLRFESSSPRFLNTSSDSPGPGQYLIKEKKTGNGVIHSTENRFGYHANYIPPTNTDYDIGPGTYHKETRFDKKTFNIAPQINEDRPWI